MREEDRKGTRINKTKLFYKEALRQYDLEMDSYNTLTDKANSILVSSIGTILTLLTIAVIQIVTSKVSPNPLLLMVLLIIPYTFF